jgi:hypothetical protein
MSSSHTSPILKSRQKEIILKITDYIVLAKICRSYKLNNRRPNLNWRQRLICIVSPRTMYVHAIFSLESAINLAYFRLNDLRIATWQEAPRPMPRDIRKSTSLHCLVCHYFHHPVMPCNQLIATFSGRASISWWRCDTKQRGTSSLLAISWLSFSKISKLVVTCGTATPICYQLTAIWSAACHVQTYDPRHAEFLQISWITFFYNLFTKSTDKQYRYEIPREEPREAHGYLALDFTANGCVISLCYVVGSVKES